MNIVSRLKAITSEVIQETGRKNSHKSSALEVCPESIQPLPKRYRHLLRKIQDIRNTLHRTMMPQSPSQWALWDLMQFSQLQHDAALALVAEAVEQILP